MKFKLFFSSVLLFCLTLNIFSQENKIDTTLLGVPLLKLPSLRIPPLPDTTNLHKLPEGFGFSLPEELEVPDSVLLERKWEHLGYNKKPEYKKPILPFEFTPNLDFNIRAYHWEVPVLGLTTTFSPVLTYKPTERLYFFGGLDFTQYPNAGYVMNVIDPNWPVKSNITTRGFLGGAFILNDRITLRGTYQHSLYNQMPSILIPFGPAFQTVTFGADIDVWNGLGVSVDRVWEFDRSGRMRSHMQYSPYINFGKFMKFLRGY